MRNRMKRRPLSWCLPRRRPARNKPPRRQILSRRRTKKVSSPKSSPKIAPKTPSSDKKFGKNPQDDYQNNIVKYLKANGPSNLANMGSAVKKPAGEPKIKVFAKARPATFKLTGDIISLVK